MLPISLTVSLDGVSKQTFEAIRVKSNFDEVLLNLHRFRNYARTRHTYFSIAFCLMRQNWQEFVDVLLFAEDIDCDVFVNTVISPSNCSIYTLAPDEIFEIANRIEEKGLAHEHQLRRNQLVWKNAVATLKGKSDTTQRESVKKIINNYYEQENHWTSAWNFAAAGLTEEALQEIRKIKKGEPFYYQSIAYAADLQRELGRWEEAEADLQRAFKMTSRRPEAFLYSAKLRLDQNRIDDALHNALEAKKLVRPEDPFEEEINECLVRIHARQGNLPEAMNLLNGWLARDPSNEEAKKLFEELDRALD